MKKLILVLMVFCFQFSFAQDKKVVLVIADGIPADVIEQVHTPNLDQISRDGAYSRAYVGGERGSYSQTPTISAVSYNTMLTGTWVNKHNVWGNDIKDPNYNYWTIFRFMREAYPEKKLGIYSTWLDNRTKLLGDGLPQTGNLQLDFKFDGYELDKETYPHDKQSVYINQIDERVIAEAVKGIKEDSPDLSWVYLQYTDDMGHKHGDSPELIRAVEIADRQIGEIYQAMKFREQYHDEEWKIIIVTDHGRDIITGRGHGGQSVRERTIWIITNLTALNSYFYNYTPAMVDVMPTVARYLDIQVPEERLYELDGIPIVGQVSIADPIVNLKGNNLEVQWTALEEKGIIEILVSTKNDMKAEGKADFYQKLGEFNIRRQKAAIKLPKLLADSNFLKIVIRGENNTLNRWIIKD